jgi:arylsulfatase A-like enzyme
MNALAMESVVFEQAYGAAPWTLPSVASLVTSTYACEHGVVAYGRKLNPGVPTLAERLGGLGYRTAAYFSNMHAGALADLSRGYEIAEERGTRQNDRAIDAEAFLRAHQDDPFLLYLHTMEPHEPFHTPAPVISRFGHVGVDERENFRALWLRLNDLRSADWSAGRPIGTTDNSSEQREILRYLSEHRDAYELLYDAAVADADAHLGRTIDVLKAAGLWERSLFILLADHGEEFGEHGNWLHGQAVYEEQLRVPLLVHFPRGEFAGRRIAQAVSLVDVMPTVLDFLGRSDLCGHCRGRSLLPMLNRAQANDHRAQSVPQTAAAQDAWLPPAYFPALRMNEIHYYRPEAERRGDVNVVLRRGQWKGIWNEGPRTMELYDLASDPGERSDAAAGNAELTTALRGEVIGWLDSCRGQASAPIRENVDAGTRQKLRAFGYIR